KFLIDFTKWRASNRCDEFPQMVAWLERQEKISSFATYLAWLELTRTPTTDRTFIGQAIQLAKKAVPMPASPYH
ncbi:hypothetical protein B0H13DRAFT_1633234, partial [Mycena leptocephala]